jgi:hypothetical protein
MTQNQHTNPKNPRNITKKMVTFTYCGPETRIITKLLKNTDIGIAFKTTNTIKNHLKSKNHITDGYKQNGAYQLKCNECPLMYVQGMI